MQSRQPDRYRELVSTASAILVTLPFEVLSHCAFPNALMGEMERMVRLALGMHCLPLSYHTHSGLYV
jgi:hypothetical protein